MMGERFWICVRCGYARAVGGPPWSCGVDGKPCSAFPLPAEKAVRETLPGCKYVALADYEAVVGERDEARKNLEFEIGAHTFTVESLALAEKALAAIDTPEIEDFLLATEREAKHQIKRWGQARDRDKSAEHWFWLVGYLAGKALRAAITGNREKALHHTISSAAALYNWHQAIKADRSGAGIGHDADLRKDNPIDAQSTELAG